jgi:cytochrome c oxidase assembly protein subunit 15
LLARPREAASTSRLYGWLVTFGALLVLQVTYGAFVAGLDAGKAFNTYPLMAGSFWPPAAWRLEPPRLNLLDNIATVQWIHRTLPLLLLVGAAGLLVAALRRRAEPGGRLDVGWAAVLLSGVLIQGALGVATLLSSVALDLAAIHQATALLLFGTWVLWLHRATRLRLAVRP